LKLRLVITGQRRRTTLECWPPFPLCIWSLTDSAYGLSPDLVTALKHPDRIHGIDLNVSTSMLAKSMAWIENSFPASEDLFLRSRHGGDHQILHVLKHA
jgi:hypothetical protein